jgi:hypothetical protein
MGRWSGGHEESGRCHEYSPTTGKETEHHQHKGNRLGGGGAREGRRLGGGGGWVLT